MPHALGSGASAAVHKASALLFSWSVGRVREDLGRDLDNFRCSFFGYCSDMGTELGLAELQVKSIECLLPRWYASSSLEVDADMHDMELQSPQAD
eukprot:8652523-Pyramimonas_sp.AAC.1